MYKQQEALDRTSPVPLYYQLKQIFHSWITLEKFGRDGRFPSEKELQEIFPVSRMTIRRALSELVAEGYLVRERGRGSFVVRSKVQDRLVRLTSFTEDMQAQGSRVESYILTFDIVCDPTIAKKMGVPENEELVKLSRLRLVDGEPRAVQNAFIRHIFCPSITDQGLLAGSLYTTLEEKYGLKLARAFQTIEAKPADSYEAELLNIVVGYPVLLLERLTYLADGQPIEFTRSTYRGDRYRFAIELSRQCGK
ncbi:MAG: GntR family transcriptional regulator [Candidatus Hadarchaeum sp.]|uniref:GntR family transcriptional regulator n=1 Tax=Candidatus Hadarchaeum sp. TaxID=2883567 RepID=UPI00316FC689